MEARGEMKPASPNQISETKPSQKITGLVVGHLLAIATGIAIAMLGAPGNSSDGNQAPATSIPSKNTTGQMDSRPWRATHSIAGQTESASSMAEAWKNITALPYDQQMEARRQILRDWIMEDPDVAMEALLATTGLSLSALQERGGLFDEFLGLHQKNPDWFVARIQSHRYGLATGLLANWWCKLLAGEDPLRLATLAPEFGTMDGSRMITQATQAAMKDQTLLDGIMSRLEAMPEGEAKIRMWTAAGKGVSALGPDALLVYYRSAKGTDEKAMFCRGLASALARASVSPEHAAEIYAQLPKAQREIVALSAARESGRNAIGITASIDQLLGTPTWRDKAKELTFHLHNSLPSGTDAARVAEWATSLPEGTETEDLYRTAVRPYLQQTQVDEVRKWIATMPKGWQRDNTLAAWVQATANADGDPAIIDWAADRIESPYFRGQAAAWRVAMDARKEKNKPAGR